MQLKCYYLPGYLLFAVVPQLVHIPQDLRFVSLFQLEHKNLDYHRPLSGQFYVDIGYLFLGDSDICG
jgi:hypothetical protein